MATYTPSTNTDPTKAVLGEKSTGVLALQNAINAVSPTKIATDSMYGNQTKGAYDSLIGQGYVYQNGAFVKPAKIGTSISDSQKLGGSDYVAGAGSGSSTIPPVTPTPARFIYTDENAPKTVTEKSVDQVQQDLLRQSQAEIDNINAYYDTIYNETKTLGEKNTRGTNAVSVLSGLAGSSEADVAMKETEKGNTQMLNKVNQERGLAINSILSKIRTNAVEQARQSRLDAQKSEEDRIAYRTKQAEESSKMLADLSKVGSGATLEGLKATLDDSSYKHLIDTVGGELNAKAILFENRSKDTILGTPRIMGGKVVQAYQTPEGKVIYEDVDLPVGVVPDKVKQIIKDDAGIFIINNDGTWSNITNSGTTTGKGGGKPIKSGGITFSGEQIGAFSKTLEDTRGPDGYVDPYVYKQAYDAWIESKALAKDFLTQYPPNKYVNPLGNKILPPLLQNTTKASTTSGGRTL